MLETKWITLCMFGCSDWLHGPRLSVCHTGWLSSWMHVTLQSCSPSNVPERVEFNPGTTLSVSLLLQLSARFQGLGVWGKQCARALCDAAPSFVFIVCQWRAPHMFCMIGAKRLDTTLCEFHTQLMSCRYVWPKIAN